MKKMKLEIGYCAGRIKKNMCEEEEGADGPNGDPVCLTQS